MQRANSPNFSSPGRQPIAPIPGATVPSNAPLVSPLDWITLGLPLLGRIWTPTIVSPATLSNNAEGGSDGVAPTTADVGSGDSWTVVNTGSGSGAVLVYTATTPAHGSLAYRMGTRATAIAQNVAMDAPSGALVTKAFHRFYFMVDVTPTVAANIAAFFTRTGTQGGGILLLGTDLKFKINNNNGSLAAQMATVLTAGTWYRVEVAVAADGSPTTTIQVQLYAGDSTTVLEDSGPVAVVNGAAVLNIGRLYLGRTAATANAPSTTGFYYFDDVVMFGDDWIGPVAGGVTDVLAPAFAGTSSLAPTVVEYQEMTAGLAGTSSLAPTVVPYQRITASLAGTSSLAPTVTPYQRFAVALAGTSSLSATVVELHRFTVALAGTSSLAATPVEYLRFTAALAGSSSLAASPIAYQRIVATFAGSSTLSASTVELHRFAVSLAGTSSLVGGLAQAAGRFAAALAGSSSLAATVVEYLRATVAFAGSSSLAAAPVALRRYVATLSGSSTLAAAVAAYERVAVGLAGSSSLAAQLVPRQRFAAALAGSSTFTTTLAARRAIVATLSGSSTLSLSLVDYRRFVASLSGSSTLSATPTLGRGLVVGLAGTSALSAIPLRLRSIGAGLAGSSTLGADLRLTRLTSIEGSVEAIDLPAATVSATNRVGATLVVVERAATVATLDVLHEATLTVEERRPLVTATDRPV